MGMRQIEWNRHKSLFPDFRRGTFLNGNMRKERGSDRYSLAVESSAEFQWWRVPKKYFDFLKESGGLKKEPKPMF